MGKMTANVQRTVKTAEVTVKTTGGVVGFVWRHRVGLGPFLAGLGVVITSVMLGWLIEDPLWTYGSILLGTALLLAAVRFGISDREGKTHARRERVHLYVVTLAAAGLVSMYQHYVLPGAMELKTAIVILLWAIGILGAPWWWNLRRRSRVALENDLDAWPVMTTGTTLAKTWWSSYKKTATGWTGLLHLPPQLSRRAVLQQNELIEGLTNAPADSITIEPAGRNSNLVRVTCIQKDPHADAIPWDGRSARSIRDLVLLGKYDDGSLERTAWFENGVGGFHRLLGGATRSGKSGLMHLMCALYGPAEDVVLWGIDLKGGTALLPWAPMFDWVATTVDEAMFMMLCAEQMTNARAATLGRRGKEVAPVGPTMPAVLIFCDEISSLIGDSAPRHVSRRAGPAMVEVGKKGAGMGIFMLLATQYPTLGALRDSQLKSQLTWRACFRLAEPQQGHYVLPNMHKGVDPYNIPDDRKGTCYIDAKGKFRYATLRIVYFNHERLRRSLVERYWQTTPEIDAMTLRWGDQELVEVYRKRTIWTPDMLDRVAADEEIAGARVADLYDDTDDVNADGVVDDADAELEGGDDMTDTDEPITSAVTRYADADPDRARHAAAESAAWLESRRLGTLPERTARDIMYEACRDAWPHGISPRDLMRACNRPEQTIHRWLRDDEKAGIVTRLSYGRYAVEPTRWVVGPDGKPIQVNVDADHALDDELGRRRDE